MKHINYLFIFALVLFIGASSVNALSCSSEDNRKLNQMASYIKVSYEVTDNSTIKEITADGKTTTYRIPNYVFDISIYNIVDGIYVKVVNNVNDEELTITPDMTEDGTYTFINDDFGTIYNYTFTVESSKEACYGEKIKTLRMTKPKYNAYSEFNYCKNSSNLYCQRFVGQELSLKGSKDFLEKIYPNNKKDEKSDNSVDTTKDELKNNWKIYLIVFIVVVLGASGVIFYLNWRKNRRGIEL